MGTTAIILAAGSGRRFGGETPKQLLSLAGRPIVIRSVEAFRRSPLVNDTFVVTSADVMVDVRALLDDHRLSDVEVVAGGATRADSTRAALERFTDRPAEKILLHDAVRPLVSDSTIARCVRALDRFDAAVAVAAVTDTLFAIEDDALEAIPDREGFRRAQTPQGFRAGVLAKAFALADQDPDFSTTDDIGVVHRYLPDVAISLVDGSPENLKITTPADLVAAEALLADRTP